MSTNLFTAEQDAYLRGFNIDTNLPVFPLSCEIAWRLINAKFLLRDYDEALEIKAKGGYESNEEHKKKYIKELLRSDYRFHIILFAILALIIGSIAGALLQDSIWRHGLFTEGLHTYHMSDATITFCKIMKYVFIVLSFVILNAGSILSFLIKNHQNIKDEMESFKFDVDKYHKTLKECEENYQNCKERYQKLLEVMRIIAANREAIPEKYWIWGGRFLSYYNDRKANNVSEAIRVFEEDQHRLNVKCEMERQTELAEQANIAAQEALQTARNAQVSASIAVGIANSNDYHPNNHY